jgi:DNA-binding FadR family transcriptional regulator
LEASGNSHLQRNESLVRMTEEVFRPRYGLLTEHILAVSAAHAAVVSALRAGDQDSAELQIRSYISHELHIISQQERLSQ